MLIYASARPGASAERDADGGGRHEIALCWNVEVARIPVDDAEDTGKACGLYFVEGAAVKTTAPAANLARGRFNLLGGQTLVRLGPHVLEKRKDSVWSEHPPDLREGFLHVVH